MSDAGYSMLGAGAQGWPRGMLWGGRWEGGSCLGMHVHPWWIHVNVWQNQYSILKENKVKIKIKKKIDAFQLWCWRWVLRVPWTAKRSNQSILKEISPGCSLEGLMLKLKLQCLATWCEELTHLKRPWCWEKLKAGGEGDDRGWDGWRASPTQWTWVWVNSGSWWWIGSSGIL